MRDLAVTSSSIKSYPQGVDKVAPKKENEMNTNTNAPIVLTSDDITDKALAMADTAFTVPNTYADNGTVYTFKVGQYYTESQTSGAMVIGDDLVALTLFRYYTETDTGEDALNDSKIFANMFVSRDHARKFALEILKALEEDN